MENIKQQKLDKWINQKIQEAKSNNEPLFMGVPDSWFEQGFHFCCNGHINFSYLKSELRGALCLNCFEKSYILPVNTTQEELNKVLL